MNSTYHLAIKITPHQVAFNRVPNYQTIAIPLRNISEAEIEEQEVDHERDKARIDVWMNSDSNPNSDPIWESRIILSARMKRVIQIARLNLIARMG